MGEVGGLMTAAAAARNSLSNRLGNGRSANLTANPGLRSLDASSTMPGCARSMTSITGRNISLFPSPL